ncbi:hypothetical protein LEMLEM_LOCUS17146, partial [Lemmus lemmus]
MRKVWYIDTMGYYTAEKNNSILNFADKMDEARQNSIWREVTQTQKDNDHMYSIISGFQTERKINSSQITIPEKLDNNEDPK